MEANCAFISRYHCQTKSQETTARQNQRAHFFLPREKRQFGALPEGAVVGEAKSGEHRCQRAGSAHELRHPQRQAARLPGAPHYVLHLFP